MNKSCDRPSQNQSNNATHKSMHYSAYKIARNGCRVCEQAKETAVNQEVRQLHGVRAQKDLCASPLKTALQISVTILGHIRIAYSCT